jgi:dTDP-4-dehydrorhamnose 3,5-epimerase
VEFRPTELPDVVLVVPDVHRDARGFFLEIYHAHKYEAGGIRARFVQDNQSRSRRGTLRGLHAQVRSPQGKLVRVVRGEIWDVAVDIRPSSPTFGRWAGAALSEDNAHQLWIPPGFGHGFCVISEEADVEYKCTTLYDPTDEIAIRWDDPAVGIPWPIRDPVISARDRAAPPLRECLERLKEMPR